MRIAFERGIDAAKPLSCRLPEASNCNHLTNNYRFNYASWELDVE
jgi:hypothetical protein